MFYLQFCDSSDNENVLCSKGLTRNFCKKIIVAIVPTTLVTNSLLTYIFSFLKIQKQESGFQQVGGLVMRNISGFCLWWIALYLKAMLNSIDFCKGIFIHVIPVRIIVSWNFFTTSHAFDGHSNL